MILLLFIPILSLPITEPLGTIISQDNEVMIIQTESLDCESRGTKITQQYANSYYKCHTLIEKLQEYENQLPSIEIIPEENLQETPEQSQTIVPEWPEQLPEQPWPEEQESNEDIIIRKTPEDEIKPEPLPDPDMPSIHPYYP